MDKYYFPKCPVEGPIDPPVPYFHGCFKGSIPQKCHNCKNSFEGECLRGMETVGRYLRLDYGPCGKPGRTDPVPFEDSFVSSVLQVPRKCAICKCIQYSPIFGFTCIFFFHKKSFYFKGSFRSCSLLFL